MQVSLSAAWIAPRCRPCRGKEEGVQLTSGRKKRQFTTFEGGFIFLLSIFPRRENGENLEDAADDEVVNRETPATAILKLQSILITCMWVRRRVSGRLSQQRIPRLWSDRSGFWSGRSFSFPSAEGLFTRALADWQKNEHAKNERELFPIFRN